MAGQAPRHPLTPGGGLAVQLAVLVLASREAHALARCAAWRLRRSTGRWSPDTDGVFGFMRERWRIRGQRRRLR